MPAPTLVLSRAEIVNELVKCKFNSHYFISRFVQIKPAASRNYKLIKPYRSQAEVLRGIVLHKFVILLKARQLGQTTIVIAFAIWLARFRQNSTILLFSKGLRESVKLLDMIRQMFKLLPYWMRPQFTIDARTHLQLDNNSQFVCFGSKGSGGDSWTADLCIIDEADLVPELETLLGGVAPTMANGGKLIPLSRPDKDKPNSEFKQIFRGALSGDNNYWPKFLPWHCVPGRDQKFYDEMLAAFKGSTDAMWEQYPSSVEEALAPRQESKRIPLKWLESCAPPLNEMGLRQWVKCLQAPHSLLGQDGVKIYREPVAGRQYVIGVDLASGKGSNPNLDYSVAQVLDKASLEQVAVLAAKLEPSIMGDYTAKLARHYNKAGVLVERNGQYGGACLMYLQQQCPDINVIIGNKGEPGFDTTHQSKIDLYVQLSEGALVKNYLINDEQTFMELASIEAATLEAPSGFHDDRAMAFGIALYAAERPQFEFQGEEVSRAGKIANIKKGNDGITYIPYLDEFVVVVVAKDKDVGIGKYATREQAEYAHAVACGLLKLPPQHRAEDYEYELGQMMAERIKSLVAAKLKQAKL